MMGRKIHICVVLNLLLICFTLQSCSQKVFDNALLWKVSGNGLQEPSYIFGTHHLANIAFLDSINGFDEAFNSSSQVVGELVISPETIYEMQLKMLQSARFGVGDSYKRILSPEDYKRLCDGLASIFEGQVSNIEKFRPGFIGIMLAQTMYSMVSPTFDPIKHEAIDAYLQRTAREKGKPTLGLETIDDQIVALFESESLRKQSEILICGLENIEYGKSTIITLNELYKKAALTELYNLSFHNENDPCPTPLRQLNAINKDRNDKWLKILPDIMKEKSSFVVVGALHLAGKDGLLSQLDEMGYSIEPVGIQ